MKRYRFFDTDETGRADYDIVGRDYVDLIRVCCKYSAAMCLRLSPNHHVGVPPELAKYWIEKPENIRFDPYDRGGNKKQEDIVYFRVCDELPEKLLNLTSTLWGWIWDEPSPGVEDPVFFREDGSIFFVSITHDGQCALYVREGEDVLHIVTREHWVSEWEGNIGRGHVLPVE